MNVSNFSAKPEDLLQEMKELLTFKFLEEVKAKENNGILIIIQELMLKEYCLILT